MTTVFGTTVGASDLACLLVSILGCIVVQCPVKQLRSLRVTLAQALENIRGTPIVIDDLPQPTAHGLTWIWIDTLEMLPFGKSRRRFLLLFIF